MSDPNSADGLQAILQDGRLWRARQGARADAMVPTVATGFAALDAALPGGGWPLGALTELLCEYPGQGELSVLLPAITTLAAHRPGSWTVWVAPPHILYPPALARHGIDLSRTLVVRPRDDADAAWAMEQALRAGACSAVLGWLAQTDDRNLRRLQLAAESGRALSVVLRPIEIRRQSSPATLRATLGRAGGPDEALSVQLLKCRGRTPCRVRVNLTEGTTA